MDTLHLKAPGSWLNDPNGFIYYKGRYHLFYQHFPFATRWGTMHWGHAVSDDLVHWEHLGVALFPTKYFDADGIFSGGAFEKDGKMLLYYTGVRYYTYEPECRHVSLNDVYECTQAMIESEDGETFDNYDGKKVIIPCIYDNDIANFNHTRDPKVWEEDGKYYMVIGSTYKKETGRLLVAQSDDAYKWEIKSVTTDKKFGRILECPDMFELDGERFLLASPMFIVPESEGYPAQSMIGKLDFDPETCEVSNLGEFSFIDHGRDAYATQSCVDEEGRRVMVIWIRMPEAIKYPSDKKAWNGMMTIPRVIENREDGIHFSMHPNVKKYFDKELTLEEIKDFDPRQEKPWMAKTTIKNGDEINLGGFKIWMEDNTIHTDRSEVLVHGTDRLRTTFEIPSYADEYELEIVVEPSVVELYVDDGKHVLTNVFYGLKNELFGNIGHIYVSSEE